MNLRKPVLQIGYILLIFYSSLVGQPDSLQLPHPRSLVVESIEIQGNTKTRPEVIRYLLDFQEGDRIDQARLNRNVRHLNESGFFKDVDVYTQPGSERGRIVVFIEIKERRYPYLQFKSGYNELDGWYISPIGLRFDNLFGRGNRLGFEFLIGDRVTGTDLGFSKINLFRSELNFRLLFFARTRQFVHYLNDVQYLQEVKQGGLSLRFNGNRGFLRYLWIEFVSENFDADNFMSRASNSDERSPLPEILLPDIGEKKIGRLILSAYLDTRDRRIYPTLGWWGSISFDQVSTQFGAYTDFKKAILDVRKYQEIGHHWVIALRAKGAWVEDKAPFYEKFYLGGPNSLRGYKDRGLNPLGYASRLVQGSVELRFPLTRPNFPNHFITGVLFLDSGQAWSEKVDFDRGAFRSSVGYGFRFKLPIVGLLRLDFAYPIPSYEFRLHVSLGHTF